MWELLLLLLLLLLLPLDDLSQRLVLRGFLVWLVMRLLWNPAHAFGQQLTDIVEVSIEMGLSCHHAFICKSGHCYLHCLELSAYVRNSGQRYLHSMELSAHCFDLAESIIEGLLFPVFHSLTMT